MQERPRRILRLVVTPIIESVLVGILGGGMALVILPNGINTLSSGVIPGFVVGLMVGVVLAGLHLRTDNRSAQTPGGGLRVVLWVTGAFAAAFLATAFFISNPQIPGLERLILCSGVAIVYGFLTYRALTPKK